MAESLDNILSGQTTAPEQETPTPVETVETPAQEAPTPAPGTEPDEPQPLDVNGQKMVPHAALHAQKEKVKRYTEQVASFENTLKERETAWERRFGQILEKIAPAQPEQPQQPVDWYADPDAAFKQNLAQAVTPLESTVSKLEQQIIRMSAVQAHGVEKVTEFEKYVTEALNRGDPEMGVLSAQMRASQDPMATGIQWLEKRTFDPEKERERIKAELLKEIQPEQPVTPTPVFPSPLATARNVGTRAGPAWAGPPPLADIFKR